MSSLNEDVMVEILSKLPMESLFRFKSVSKQWNQCISGSSFLKTKSLSTSGFMLTYLIRNEGGKIEKVTKFVPFPCNRPCANVTSSLASYGDYFPIDSCNGLILYNYRHNSRAYFVVNPVTKQMFLIPLARGREYYSSIAGIAFDPQTSLHFRIVRCAKTLHGRRALEIYSSETGRWSDILEDIETFCKFAFLKGVMYLSPERAQFNSVLRIDLETNIYRRISLPMISKEMTLGKCKERITYCVFDKVDLMIWMLDEEEYTWILLHVCSSITLTKLCDQHVDVFRHMTLCVFHPDLEAVLVGIGSKIYLYDFDSRSLTEVYNDENALTTPKLLTLSFWPFKILMNPLFRSDSLRFL